MFWLRQLRAVVVPVRTGLMRLRVRVLESAVARALVCVGEWVAALVLLLVGAGGRECALRVALRARETVVLDVLL